MSTLKELEQVIEKKFGIDPQTLQPDRPLADYGLDSLSLAELLFTLEEHFGIEFPDGRQDVNTLAALAELVDQLRHQEAA
jgi:acyl carrier protein